MLCSINKGSSLFLLFIALSVVTHSQLIEDKEPKVSALDGEYCVGLDSNYRKITSRCSYPGYYCYCINLPDEYPSCQCSRDRRPSTEEPNTSEDMKIAAAADGWEPLHVIGIGSGAFVVVLLTSIACCCICRQWYYKRARVHTINIKPPDYSDSPPPPYNPAFFTTHPSRNQITAQDSSAPRQNAPTTLHAQNYPTQNYPSSSSHIQDHPDQTSSANALFSSHFRGQYDRMRTFESIDMALASSSPSTSNNSNSRTLPDIVLPRQQNDMVVVDHDS